MKRILFSAVLAAGLVACTAQQRQDVAEELPEAVPEVTAGAGEVITNPANPIGWYHIVGGLALLAASLYGGKKAVNKVRSWTNKV